MLKAKGLPRREPATVGPFYAPITPPQRIRLARRSPAFTINELVLVYRRPTHQYYRKNGEVTREATIIDDVIRFLRRHHATTFRLDFGPVALDELRDDTITDLDLSRKHINKQVTLRPLALLGRTETV